MAHAIKRRDRSPLQGRLSPVRQLQVLAGGAPKCSAPSAYGPGNHLALSLLERERNLSWSRERTTSYYLSVAPPARQFGGVACRAQTGG
jgi:hypothetical protein